MYRSQDDVAQNAMTLLSLTNTWILIRHQWLIDQVRCILTGENPIEIEPLPRYDNINPLDLDLPENLTESFMNTKIHLDALWEKTVKVSHPASGLSVFEQITDFQEAAKHFMEVSKDANHKLWQELATRDPLTGAWTRLTLNSTLNEALQSYARNKTPSTIALLDQNNFKLINDTWGHIAGDNVLTKTSEIIQANLRPGDKLFRYGGDEWLILMPQTNKMLAYATLSRIDQIFESYEFYGDADETPFHATFSYGIAEVEEKSSPKEWITNADYQLYAKKLKSKLTQEAVTD